MRENVIRRRIRFYGRVQGVGFRYYAYNSANKFGATGWVKNEFDGSVSMEIQGTEDQIRRTIDALSRGAYIRIDSADVRDIPVVEDERKFRTRY